MNDVNDEQDQLRARRQALREQIASDLALCPAPVALTLGLKPKEIAAAMRRAGATRPITARQVGDWTTGMDDPPRWLKTLLGQAALREAERQVLAQKKARRAERRAERLNAERLAAARRICTDMSLTAATPRMYLDADGVILAGHSNRVWPDVRRADVVDAGGTTTAVSWSPSLIVALDRLRTDFGVELVWLSSWCEDNNIVEFVSPALRGLRGGRTLPYVEEDGSGLWKLEALSADQAASPAPFIWADDVEVRAHGTQLVGAGALLVAPDTNVGLTPAHIGRMRQWLTETTAGR